MEKIKLLNNKTFTLNTNGVNQYNDMLSLKFLPDTMTLDAIETMFNDPENVSKICILDSFDDTIAIFNDFTTVKSIAKDTENQAVTIVLVKEDIREKVDTLETVVDDILVSMLEV